MTGQHVTSGVMGDSRDDAIDQTSRQRKQSSGEDGMVGEIVALKGE